MAVSVYLPFLGAILLAAFAGPVARNASPALATRALTLGAVVVAAASAWAIALLVMVRVLQVPLFTSETHVRLAGVGADPVPANVSEIAAIALLSVVCAAIVVVVRRQQSLRRMARLARDCHCAGDLVVLPCDVPIALALPGREGRVVISSALVRFLDGSGRRAVLAHERSHVRHRHDLYRLVVALCAAINPLMWPVLAEVAFSIERWADEDAARDVGDRSLVARTLVSVALAQAGRTSPSLALAFGADRITDRVLALDSDATRPQAIAVVGCMIPAVIGAAAAVDATGALLRLTSLGHL